MVKQVIKKQIGRIDYIEKRIFWTLFSTFILLLVSYGVFVNNAIMNAVGEQRLDKDIVTLNSDVNTMEFQYLSMKNNITLDLAISKGFVSISETKFAIASAVKNTLSSLSINEN